MLGARLSLFLYFILLSASLYLFRVQASMEESGAEVEQLRAQNPLA